MLKETLLVTGMAMSMMAIPAHASPLILTGTLFTDEDGRGSTLDLLSFDVTSAGLVTIDVLATEVDGFNGGSLVDLNNDGDFTIFDSFIRLFVDDGDLTIDDVVAENDDGFGIAQGGADGSLSDRDSYLETNLEAGSYLLAIAPWHQPDGFSFEEVLDRRLNETSTLISRPEGTQTFHDFADYTITITGAVSAPVPVPAGIWLLGSALLGLISSRRRTQI